MDERELIQRITQEVMRQLEVAGFAGRSGEQIDCTAKPLIILNQTLLNNPVVRQELPSLVREIQDLRFFCEDVEAVQAIPSLSSFTILSDSTEQEIEELLRRTSMVLLPWVPMPVLSRLVHLESECPASLLITKALWKRVKVRARKTFIQPELSLYHNHEPSPILRRVQGLVREGQQMGIEWMRQEVISELFTVIPEPVNPGKKRLLTAADVRALRDVGEIVLPQGTIITPLARDEIKRYGLQVRLD